MISSSGGIGSEAISSERYRSWLGINPSKLTPLGFELPGCLRESIAKILLIWPQRQAECTGS